MVERNIYRALRGLAARVMRFPRTCGFGVQSPSDYRLITVTLHKELPQAVSRALPADKHRARLCRLAWLAAGGRGAKRYICIGCSPDIERFMAGFCRQRGFVRANDTPSAELIIISATALCEDIDAAERLVESVPDGACMIVADIDTSPATRSAWRRIYTADRARITIDTYRSGIVLFDAKRFKQHYKIWF
ncbi:MAG: hypothetical protein LUC22_02870 [Prevotella sp.]|nr:hypothetical protein [Prevotella sp.]